MGVFDDLFVGLAAQHSACHAQVDDPLRMIVGRLLFGLAGGSPATTWAILCWFQIDDDVLSYPPHTCDFFGLQCRGKFCGWRLQWLRLLAQPDGFDYVSLHPAVQAAGDGFYLGKFGHVR